MVEHIFILVLKQLVVNLRVILSEPMVEPEINNKEFVIHLAGGDSKQKKLGIESERRTGIAD